MDKNLNSIKQHLENLGFKFFNDSSYWDWGGQQFYDNQISEKKIK